MLMIRPIQARDYDGLFAIAQASGHGFTSLPTDKTLLTEKIARAEASFKLKQPPYGNELYLMVLEDTNTGKVVGSCGLETSVGLHDACYHYHIGTEIHHSSQLKTRKVINTLKLCHDYTGATELCSLFLQSDYRKGNNGRFLSRNRFLFLAQHQARFNPTVIAELRGMSDEQGQSPFFHWLEEHFIGIDFAKADYLSGLGVKTFISEMMPRHPIYLNLLPESAQAVIGKVHPNTRPAKQMLCAEGFSWRNYVDIFDGGPTLECQLADIRSVQNSQLIKVAIGKTPAQGAPYIVANTQVEHYRAVIANIQPDADNQEVIINQELADILKINSNDQVRILAL